MEYWKNKSQKNLTEIVDGSLITEEWMPVKGYEKRYDVSSFGRVRHSFNTPFKKYAGVIKFQRKKVRVVKGKLRGGYCHVKFPENGVDNSKYVHRLVADAFIPNPQNKPFVNHLKGIKHDNRFWELEWSTGKENSQHAYEIGLILPLKGEDNVQSKITNEIALEIFNDKRTHVEIAKSYGLYPATVGFIKKGSSWSHVTGKKYQRKRLTTEAIIALKQDSLTMSKKQLSAKYNKTISHIENILAGRVCKKQKSA